MKKFPNIIPIFPLSGVIYFPKTNLPLNIFEQRYLNLINDAYNKDKLMGMVQSKKENKSVYEIGCLGKISDYQKSKGGRILINLTGISRFKILKEIPNDKLYPFKYWNESKGEGRRGSGYSGTSIWCKEKPIEIKYEFNDFKDTSGRFIFLEFEAFSLINMYCPNSGGNLDYRKEWDIFHYFYIKISYKNTT